MKKQIGVNAGIIWRYLDENGKKTVKEIKTATKLVEKDVYAALGWLAREEKILLEKAEKEKDIAARLK